MLQSSCKGINNLIQRPPSIPLRATATMCRAITFSPISSTVYANSLALLFKWGHTKLGPIFTEILSLQVTHNTTESQLKLAGNESVLAGRIGLCFLCTEANQIVHLPVSQAALVCQKPHYSPCRVKKRHDGVHVQHKRIPPQSCCFFFCIALPCLPLFTKSSRICNE